MLMSTRFLTLLRRTRDRMRKDSRAGNAAIEFAFIAPVLFLFIFGIIEVGVIYFAQSALQNATDDAARLIQTGQVTGMTNAQFVSQVCGEMSEIIASGTCTTNLQVDVREYSSFTGSSYPSVTNANGSINTGNLQYPSTFTACQVTLVRTFYPWSIMTPLLSTLLATMPNGQFLLTSAAAFRSEPYT